VLEKKEEVEEENDNSCRHPSSVESIFLLSRGIKFLIGKGVETGRVKLMESDRRRVEGESKESPRKKKAKRSENNEVTEVVKPLDIMARAHLLGRAAVAINGSRGRRRRHRVVLVTIVPVSCGAAEAAVEGPEAGFARVGDRSGLDAVVLADGCRGQAQRQPQPMHFSKGSTTA
jgi:hypothetical protein